jgi:hypothetical protein
VPKSSKDNWMDMLWNFNRFNYRSLLNAVKSFCFLADKW